MNIILGSLLIFFTSFSFAQISASVNKTQFYPNDVVTFTLKANGDVVFPNITNISGNIILGTSSSRAIQIINGRQSQTISKSYNFKPVKSLTIPEFEIEVDGKFFKTNPIKLTILKPLQGSNGDDFILELKADKNEFFAGEYLDLQVVFKQKKSTSFAGNININPLKGNGLEFFTDNIFSGSEDNNYTIYTAKYRVRGSKIGMQVISPAIAILSDRVSGFSGFFNTRKRKIFSNELSIKVLPLPDNLTIFGDFTITSRVDKVKVESGEAVNLIVEIIGDGNLEDIESFNPKINKGTVYSDKPIIENGKWVQKFAITSQNNFIIPSFELNFFDKKTKTKKQVKTLEIKILTKNTPTVVPKIIQNITPNSRAKIISTKVISGYEFWQLIVSFVFGMLCIVIAFFVKKQFYKSNKDNDLITKIKYTHSDKKLFAILLPLNIRQLDNILQQLEANIYNDAKNKVDKKIIINILKLEFLNT